MDAAEVARVTAKEARRVFAKATRQAGVIAQRAASVNRGNSELAKIFAETKANGEAAYEAMDNAGQEPIRGAWSGEAPEPHEAANDEAAYKSMNDMDAGADREGPDDIPDTQDWTFEDNLEAVPHPTPNAFSTTSDNPDRVFGYGKSPNPDYPKTPSWFGGKLQGPQNGVNPQNAPATWTNWIESVSSAAYNAGASAVGSVGQGFGQFGNYAKSFVTNQDFSTGTNQIIGAALAALGIVGLSSVAYIAYTKYRKRHPKMSGTQAKDFVFSKLTPARRQKQSTVEQWMSDMKKLDPEANEVVNDIMRPLQGKGRWFIAPSSFVRAAFFQIQDAGELTQDEMLMVRNFVVRTKPIGSVTQYIVGVTEQQAQQSPKDGFLLFLNQEGQSERDALKKFINAEYPKVYRPSTAWEKEYYLVRATGYCERCRTVRQSDVEDMVLVESLDHQGREFSVDSVCLVTDKKSAKQVLARLDNNLTRMCAEGSEFCLKPAFPDPWAALAAASGNGQGSICFQCFKGGKNIGTVLLPVSRLLKDMGDTPVTPYSEKLYSDGEIVKGIKQVETTVADAEKAIVSNVQEAKAKAKSSGGSGGSGGSGSSGGSGGSAVASVVRSRGSSSGSRSGARVTFSSDCSDRNVGCGSACSDRSGSGMRSSRIRTIWRSGGIRKLGDAGEVYFITVKYDGRVGVVVVLDGKDDTGMNVFAFPSRSSCEYRVGERSQIARNLLSSVGFSTSSISKSKSTVEVGTFRQTKIFHLAFKATGTRRGVRSSGCGVELVSTQGRCVMDKLLSNQLSETRAVINVLAAGSGRFFTESTRSTKFLNDVTPRAT